MFLLKTYDLSRLRRAEWAHLLLGLFIFILLMVLVVLGYQTAQQSIVDDYSLRSRRRSSDVDARIMQRLEIYDNFLRAGKGYFITTESTSRDAWEQFVDAFDLLDRYGGAVGVGYAQLISNAEIQSFENSLRSEGIGGFEFNPSVNRDQYAPITYIEPTNPLNQELIGYDLLSEKVNREAMEDARLTRKSIITVPVSLTQDAPEEQKDSIIMHKALFTQPDEEITEQNSQQLNIGYYFAQFEIDELFDSIFESDTDVAFTVDDVTGEDTIRIYASDGIDDGESPAQTATLSVYGRDWKISHFVNYDLVALGIRNRPRNVALAGTLLSISLASLIYMLLRQRTRKMSEIQIERLQGAKDELLSMASHQLRTPATGVKQYLGMALDGFAGELNNDLRSILERAYRNNERQLKIINEFLYVAKADADRLVVEKSEFDLSKATRELIKDMRSELENKNHTISAQLPDKCKVFADPHMTHMIMENLLSNAVKYTPNGGHIDIKLSAKEDRLRWTIKDNGVGISEKYYPKLFKQFSRIPNSLTNQTSGSGMGLYLAQKLAHLGGGKITFSSRHGRGSIFNLYIPR